MWPLSKVVLWQVDGGISPNLQIVISLEISVNLEMRIIVVVRSQWLVGFCKLYSWGKLR